MDKFYAVGGMIMFLILGLMLVYAVLYFIYAILHSYYEVVIKRKNWYQFHIEKRVISSLILSHKYSSDDVNYTSGVKLWLLKYRLRNIRNTPQSNDFTTIYKHRNHQHFWIEEEILFEAYKTIRGHRYMAIRKMPLYQDTPIFHPNPNIFQVKQS